MGDLTGADVKPFVGSRNFEESREFSYTSGGRHQAGTRFSYYRDRLRG